MGKKGRGKKKKKWDWGKKRSEEKNMNLESSNEIHTVDKKRKKNIENAQFATNQSHCFGDVEGDRTPKERKIT